MDRVGISESYECTKGLDCGIHDACADGKSAAPDLAEDCCRFQALSDSCYQGIGVPVAPPAEDKEFVADRAFEAVARQRTAGKESFRR